MNKIWVYLADRKKLIHIERDNPKLDWNYKYTPKGMARYTPSLARPNKTEYVEVGNTREECLVKVNSFVLGKINRLKDEIKMLEIKLVRDEDV